MNVPTRDRVADAEELELAIWVGRNFLRASLDECIVVDLPRSLYSVREQVFQEATHIVLVTELSLPALRDSIRLLGIIEEAAPKTPIKVVVNCCKGGQQAMG